MNLVVDGAFDGAAEPPSMPGYEVYGAGETIGQWVVEQGYVDLNSIIYHPSPSGSRSIDLNGEIESSVYHNALQR